MTTIKFFVPGIPQSRGSKSAFPRMKKDGSLGVGVSDSNPKSKNWMAMVAHETAVALGVSPRPEDSRLIWVSPIGLHLTFIMPRPQSHYHHRKSGTVLREDAPKYHTKKPDRGKLQRAVEDALTGIAYLDDAQVCCGPVEKIYGDRPGVEITITPMG